MTSQTKRLIRELAFELLHDREDKTVLRPVLLAMLKTAVDDFERFHDRRHASNRVRDFDILLARNQAAKQARKVR